VAGRESHPCNSYGDASQGFVSERRFRRDVDIVELAQRMGPGRKIADLKAALADGSDPEALEAARAMIDKVLIWPPETHGNPPGIDLIGELLAMRQADLGGGTARGGRPQEPIEPLPWRPVR
jgi:formylmethanofuran dehydrogenase subunit B